MRVSRAQSEENQRIVVERASELLRTRGLDGVSLVELMKSAGLTPGGFYKKFESRDDLLRQAMRTALKQTRQKLTHAAVNAESSPLAALLDEYLTAKHRNEPECGCAFAAVGAEVSRSPDTELKSVFSNELNLFFELIEGVMASSSTNVTKDQAIGVFSTIVGAVLLSRITQDAVLAKRILQVAKTTSLNQLREHPIQPYGGAE